MLDVLSLAAPIYLMIAAGFLLVKSNYLPNTTLPGLSQFVLKICVPVLIFLAVSKPGSLQALNWTFTIGYGVAGLLTAAIVTAILRLFLGTKLDLAVILGLGASSANSIFLGLPIAAIVIGDLATTIFAWVMIAENLIVIPLLVALADSAQASSTGFLKSLRNVLMSFVKSPLMAALILGLGFSTLSTSMPAPIDISLKMIRDAAPVMTLVLVGGFIATERMSGHGAAVTLVASGKLIFHPVLVALVLWMLPGMDHDLILGGALFACVPMFTIFTIFASKHGGANVASGALILTTILGAVTVTIALLLASNWGL
ncbi:MAG: AEC family transporter [Mangrovicoccus sp.]